MAFHEYKSRETALVKFFFLMLCFFILSLLLGVSCSPSHQDLRSPVIKSGNNNGFSPNYLQKRQIINRSLRGITLDIGWPTRDITGVKYGFLELVTDGEKRHAGIIVELQSKKLEYIFESRAHKVVARIFSLSDFDNPIFVSSDVMIKQDKAEVKLKRPTTQNAFNPIELGAGETEKARVIIQNK